MPNSARRILVIENDASTRELLRDILEAEGFQPLLADHWLDPDDLRQLRPAALLIDPFNSELVSAWDYLRLLRAQPGMVEFPVVLCTGHHEQLRDATAADLALTTSVVLKPFDLDELLDTINAAIEPRKTLEPLPWPAIQDAETHGRSRRVRRSDISGR